VRHWERVPDGDTICAAPRYGDPVFDSEDYVLFWPSSLFVAEANALLAQRGDVSDLTDDPFIDAVGARRAVMHQLIDAAPSLPTQTQPAPYFAMRHGRALAPSSDDLDRGEQLHRDWVALVNDLRGRGYVERVAPGLAWMTATRRRLKCRPLTPRPTTGSASRTCGH